MNRRAFIQTYGACALFFATSAKGAVGWGELAIKTPSANLTKAMEAWYQSESLSPRDYLKSANIESSADPETLKLLMSAEFRHGKTVMLNGFVLSKIEVALLLEFLQVI